MNAKDLMVGDWVKINDSSYSTPMRIDGVKKNVNSYYVWFPRWGWGVDVRKLNPIPITPDILEKNEFERDKKLPKIWHLKGAQILKLKYQENGLYTIRRGRTNVPFAKIKFVHQLQHALKLCGIWEEIQL